MRMMLPLFFLTAALADEPAPPAELVVADAWGNLSGMLQDMAPIALCWVDGSPPDSPAVTLYRERPDHLEPLPGADGATLREAKMSLPDEPPYIDSPGLPLLPCPPKPIRVSVVEVPSDEQAEEVEP